MSRPYIDPAPLDSDFFRFHYHIFRITGGIVNSLLQVLIVFLMYLDWGRGGLLGEGSSVVELGENLVPWSNPRDLDVYQKCVMFFFVRGWGVLILGIFPGVVAARGL